DTARSVGSEIIRFASLCGGLPAPEVAGTNPIGYKFSWSPRGVLVASQNAARWKEDGKLREVAGVDLLAQAKPIIINNSFALDVLPNRDSTLFAELYGLEDIPTFFRGTLRPLHCELVLRYSCDESLRLHVPI
ncbi:lys9, partial [Symbiodinium microadriaticum]